MQSRKDEDFAAQSSLVRSRRNTEVGPDGFLMMPPNSKRSWSPRRMEGSSYSDRVLGGHRRSTSLERRRVLDDGSRRVRPRSPPFVDDGSRRIPPRSPPFVDDGSRRARSKSPPFMEAKRGGPFYNEHWVTDRDLPASERGRRYEFFDHMDVNRDEDDRRPRNEFGYSGGSVRTAMVDDRFEGRRLDGGMRELVGQKPAVMGLYKSTGDLRPTSVTERGEDRSAASLNMGLGQPGKERGPFPDARGSFVFDKYTATKQYGEGEKEIVRLRDAPYSNLTSRAKDSMGAPHFEDYARTSPRKPRVDHLGYRGDIPLPRDGYQLNSANVRQPLSPSRYGQRQHLDIKEDVARYRKETFSPSRTGHLDSLRHQPRIRENDDYLYPAENVYEKMSLRERANYNDRDMLRPNILERVRHHAETSDFPPGNMSSRDSWDHHSLEKLPANTIGLSRPPAGKREGGQYLDTASVHSRLGRKISREEEMPYVGTVQDREIARNRVDYDFKREIGTGSHKERMRSSPGVMYDAERLRLAERTHKMEGHDVPPYDSSSRILKRKYMIDDEENRITSRPMMGRVDNASRRHNRDIRDEEWIDQDVRGSSFTKRRDHAAFDRRVDKTYDETDLIPDEWFPSHESEELMHDHPSKSYKYEDKYTKGYLRSSGRGGDNSYHSNRRSVLPKWKNTWVRYENDEEVDMYSGEMEPYGDWASSAKPEPPEDSEEFKQLVHDFFLAFTKKLNDYQGVRRRYMEQGRAGSLFCIVCGRSLSKEFLDAQRLATHAFMSHKMGLRAQHLGLHKAICVMLGWNSTIVPETITWFPETLSSDESLLQREDLIIWPPVVVIYNTSISTHDPSSEGPATVEALGQFLRSKGLSGGKVRVGKPANGSIMLVKFLGTFSGLQEAEKMHQYFLKKKHGRSDLEQMTSGKGKNNKETEGENKEADQVLFGYMGIAEDLDKVDFDTKRKCSIKSKKEIHDLADAPVKPE